MVLMQMCWLLLGCAGFMLLLGSGQVLKLAVQHVQKHVAACFGHNLNIQRILCTCQGIMEEQTSQATTFFWS